MLENYARIKEFPALPGLRMAHVEEFFAGLPVDGLPVWVGELYLEFHRGTLTTQAKVKALNRAGEHRLLEAEAFAAIASLHGFAYPRQELETAWKTLLLHQFHDILPGSSIAEVYQDTHPKLEGVVATATAVRDRAVAHLGGLVGQASSGEPLIVANAALAPRPVTVFLPGHDGRTTVADVDGTALPSQPTAEGLLIHAPERAVPALGWLRLSVSRDGAGSSSLLEPGVRAQLQDGGVSLENDRLRVEIGADGTLHRVIDLATGEREVLNDRGNQLWAYVDKPRTYDAWDIEENYEQAGEEIGGVKAVDIVEEGPLRAAVQVRRVWRNSRIEQTYRVLAGSSRLDVVTVLDWHERQVYLQARFPLAVRSHEATYETMYGAVRRPTHRNTSWDAARFEVSGHRFADLSEPGYGVALLNDGKYGHSAHGDVLTLSLVRGPLYPDPMADEGQHHFTYALLPHAGDWTEAGVVAEAFALNSPLSAVPVASAGSSLPSDGGFLSVDGLPLGLGSLKRAEDGNGLVLRLYEPHGARGEALLRFLTPVRRVERVDLLEEPAEGPVPTLADDDRLVRLQVHPFEVVSLRIEPAGAAPGA
jgi:alpha-mannosidase